MAGMKEITCKCGCGKKRMVRTADIARGWGKFFDKSCKALHQERKTGQCAEYFRRKQHQNDDDDDGMFSDAHLFSNEEHDCSKD